MSRRRRECWVFCRSVSTGTTDTCVWSETLHRYESKRNGKGHRNRTANEPIPMQVFPFRSQTQEDLWHILRPYDVARVEDVESAVVGQMLGLQLRLRRWEALQPPLLKRYALQSGITVGDDLFLPSLLCCFPFGPGCRGFEGDFVGPADGSCSLSRGALTVYQGLSSGDGKKENPHSNERQSSRD
jgi:hypothetical protein